MYGISGILIQQLQSVIHQIKKNWTLSLYEKSEWYFESSTRYLYCFYNICCNSIERARGYVTKNYANSGDTLKWRRHTITCTYSVRNRTERITDQKKKIWFACAVVLVDWQKKEKNRMSSRVEIEIRPSRRKLC